MASHQRYINKRRERRVRQVRRGSSTQQNAGQGQVRRGTSAQQNLGQGQVRRGASGQQNLGQGQVRRGASAQQNIVQGQVRRGASAQQNIGTLNGVAQSLAHLPPQKVVGLSVLAVQILAGSNFF